MDPGGSPPARGGEQVTFKDLAREGVAGQEHLWQEFPPYQRPVILAVVAGIKQLHSQDAARGSDLLMRSAVVEGDGAPKQGQGAPGCGVGG